MTAVRGLSARQFNSCLPCIEDEDDGSYITDSCLGYGRPQTAHTAAKISKVKDLALIF